MTVIVHGEVRPIDNPLTMLPDAAQFGRCGRRAAYDQAAGRAMARGIARLSGAEGENESRRAQNNKLAHFSSPSWIVSSLFPTRENHSHRNKNVRFVKLRDVASACFPIAPLREASTCIRLVSQGKAAGRRSGARAVVGDRARQDFRARRPSDAWSDSALTKSGTADSV